MEAPEATKKLPLSLFLSVARPPPTPLPFFSFTKRGRRGLRNNNHAEKQVPLNRPGGVKTASGILQQIQEEGRRGGGGGGDGVNEAAASPSKRNKRRNGRQARRQTSLMPTSIYMEIQSSRCCFFDFFFSSFKFIIHFVAPIGCPARRGHGENKGCWGLGSRS